LRTHPWAAAAHGSASAGAPTRVRPGTLRRRSGAAPPATTGGGAGRSLDRNRLEPAQGGRAVVARAVERSHGEAVPLLLRLPRLLSRLRQLLVVVLDGVFLQLLQLRGAQHVTEAEPQGHRVAQGVPAGRLGQPPLEGPSAGGGDRVRLAGAWARLARPHVPLLGQRRELPVDLAPRHGPEAAQTLLGERHELA